MKLKIATCQFPVSRDLERNFEYVVRQMKYASKQGAHLAHFSETCLGGYVGVDLPSFDHYDWDLLRQCTEAVADLSRKLKLWVILDRRFPPRYRLQRWLLEWDQIWDLLQPIAKIREAEAGQQHGAEGPRPERSEFRRGVARTGHAARRDRPLLRHDGNCRLASMGQALCRGAHPGHCLRQVQGRVSLLPPDGGQGRLAPDTRSHRTRRPSGRVGRRSAGDPAGVCPQHGRGRRHCGTRTGGRVVG